MRYQTILDTYPLATYTGVPQTLYRCTCMAAPGEHVAIYGSGFTENTTAYVQAGTDTRQVIVRRRSHGHIKIRIPKTIANTAYQVYTMDGLQVSNILHVNQTVLSQLQSNEVVSNGILGIAGRALLYAGATPTARLVHTETNASVDCTFDTTQPTSQSLQYLRLGTLLVGGTYNVHYWNGCGDKATFESQLATTILVLPTGIDPFNTLIPHMAGCPAAISQNRYDLMTDNRLTAHIVGDGVTDDTAAVNAAMVIARNSGAGTVVIPKGKTALINSFQNGQQDLLQMQERVHLVGEDKTAKLRWGSANAATFSNNSALLGFQGQNWMAIGNLTFENLDAKQEAWRLIKMGQNSKYLTFANITYHGPGEGFCLNQNGLNDKVSFWNCDIAMKYVVAAANQQPNAVNRGAITAGHFNYLTIMNNVLSHEVDQIGMRSDSTNAWIAYNDCTRDCTTYHEGTQGRMFSADFVQNLVMFRNVARTLGNPPSITDGEFFVTESGGPGPRTNGYGQLLGASGTTLYFATMNWTRVEIGSVVHIYAGAGLHQHRTVVGFDIGKKTVTVDQPFTVQPNSTSWAALSNWSLRNAYFGQNTVTGFNGGSFSMYRATVENIEISSNTIYDSEGIFCEPGQQILFGDMPRQSYNVQAGVEILNNHLENRRVLTGNALYIGITAIQVGNQSDPIMHGTCAIGYVVRGNTVIEAPGYYIPNPQGPRPGGLPGSTGYTEAAIEGIYATMEQQYATLWPSVRATSAPILGAIFQGNTSTTLVVSEALVDASFQDDTYSTYYSRSRGQQLQPANSLWDTAGSTDDVNAAQTNSSSIHNDAYSDVYN